VFGKHGSQCTVVILSSRRHRKLSVIWCLGTIGADVWWAAAAGNTGLLPGVGFMQCTSLMLLLVTSACTSRILIGSVLISIRHTM
jgi:hypothetical protein